MTYRRQMRAVCMLLALIGGVISVAPASAQMDEDVVKAAALMKVPLFVNWPSSSMVDRFVIGVAADEDFTHKVAEAARGRRLQNRDVQVRRIAASEDASACHMIFVAASDDARAGLLLRSARTKPVLTVGETSAFLREGGIVRVFRSEDRLRLQINNRSAEDGGLKIDSRLLKLADSTP